MRLIRMFASVTTTRTGEEPGVGILTPAGGQIVAQRRRSPHAREGLVQSTDSHRRVPPIAEISPDCFSRAVKIQLLELEIALASRRAAPGIRPSPDPEPRLFSCCVLHCPWSGGVQIPVRRQA